jgi:hypothetical protein
MLFPTDPPVVLGPQQYLVLVKDATLFRSWYTVPASVQVLAWGAGKLSNAGESIQLCRPGELDSEGVRSWIVVDGVRYSDGSQHEKFPAGFDLWPREADGSGLSLTRTNPEQFGDDPLNWSAITPSPGTARPRNVR